MKDDFSEVRSATGGGIFLSSPNKEPARPSHLLPSGRATGLKRASPDFRDHRYGAANIYTETGQYEQKRSILEKLGDAYDQGTIGSCTGHGGAGLMQVLLPGFRTSRLGLYYETRLWEGCVGDDTGCEVRDVLKVLMKYGAIAEAEWPYDVHKFTDKPLPWKIINEALTRRIGHYSRIVTEGEFLSCIAEGFPIIFGMNLYESFDGNDLAHSGIMAWPNPREQMIGGHCMLAVGYDLRFKESDVFKASKIDPALVSDEMALVRNSWSPRWGLAGNVWVPISMILNPSIGGDAWTARL